MIQYETQTTAYFPIYRVKGVVMFYLSIPYHGVESRLSETYADLSAAKAAADEKSVYGYCVTDEGG